MERTATCVCGQLTIAVDGEPVRVNMCHCVDCQRRSGSPFQIGAIFRDVHVKQINGQTNIYARRAASGSTIDLNFCPNCGVSVFFRVGRRPGIIGVHGGCFADPDFPKPTRILWLKDKCSWVDLPDEIERFDEQAPI
jgi:hypothetical protein